nr:hypothetical protein [uncultured Cohaesibacter sp.]
MSKSPYLKNDTRLADVIAALQTMATYKFYKLDFAQWADRITGDASQGEYWKKIFIEHPEFFRLDSKREKASLVARRQQQKRYDVDTQATISRELFYNTDNKDRISRTPLSSDQLGLLVNTAIELHSRAVAKAELSLWWIPLLSGILGFLGALVGALIPFLLQVNAVGS